MKKLFAAIARAPKRSAAVLMLAAVAIVPAVLLAWGPGRPLYTVENAAPHVTFNSITNNQRVGDETNFVRIRELAPNTTFGDDVQLQPGKTYEVMLFYHNNAKSELNTKIGPDGKPVGIARNTMARVQMPGRLDAGATATITGFVSADNATPKEVWDNARGVSANAVALRIVPGSAKIASSNGAVNGKPLPNELFTTGTHIGYDKLDGVLPGCNEFSGYITYQFVVDQPNFTIDKQISVDGGKTWAESAKTTPGSTVQYRLIYKNTGTVQQDNVILKDELPAGVSYVPGSSQIANSATGGAYKATVDGITGSGGYKIGSFAPNGNNYFKFSAKIADNDKLAKCGDNTLTNKVITFTDNGSKSDTADVTVPKECKPTPKYTCDSLTVKKLDRTKFEFSTKYTVENATFKSVTYVVRNASGTEVYRGPNATFTTETVGKYTVQAIVTVTVDGKDKEVTSDKCKGEFEVTKAPVVPKYTCDSLTVKKIERTKFEFNTTYTVQNATFKHVTYVVRNASGAEIYRGTNNTYTQTTPGTYTVQAIVTVTVDGQDKEVTSDKCKATFKVDQPPVVPKYTCDNLTVKKLDRTKFEFSTAYTVENATFKNVTYVVKNASGNEVSRSQNNTFTTETVGKYTVEAFVTVTVDGVDKTVTGAKCKGEFEVTTAPKPSVSIEKKVDGVKHKTVAVNQEFTYQLVIKNTGNVDLKNVKVTDNAPTNVQFISADKGTIADNKWSYTIPELKIGASVSVAIKAKATKENLVGIKNTACVDAEEVPGTPDDCDDATIIVPPTPVPGVSIDKKVDGVEHKEVAVDQAFTYQIVVTNTGTKDLKDVKVTDNAPANVQFTAADKGTITDNKWSYVIPELKVNQSISFAITAHVTKEVKGAIINTACVDASEVTGTPDDCDDATVEVPETPVVPDITVCDTTTKTVVTIKKSEYDPAKHTDDLTKCAEAPTPEPTPETPSELPTTGFSEGVMAFVGLGSLALSVTYYAISRRSLGNL